jgi:hypothetical protein
MFMKYLAVKRVVSIAVALGICHCVLVSGVAVIVLGYAATMAARVSRAAALAAHNNDDSDARMMTL